MKKNLILSLVLMLSTLSFSQVGIGTTTPNSSSILDLTSTKKGFLPPRMTTVQRDSIVSSVAGLMIYDIDNKKFEWYDGTIWVGVEAESNKSTSTTLGTSDVLYPTQNAVKTYVDGRVSSSIYTADGTLSNARTVTQGNNNLTFVTGTAKTIVDGSFQTKGGVYANVRTVTSLPIVWADTDYMIIVKLSGVQNIILPDPTLYPGRVICIRNGSVAAGTSGTYTYLVNVPLNNTTITASRGNTYISDGTNWLLISGV